jgi:hypothetical protein
MKDNAVQFGKDFVEPYKQIAEDTKTFFNLMKTESKNVAEERSGDAEKTKEAIINNEKETTEEIAITLKDRIELLKFLGEEEKANLMALEEEKTELLRKFTGEREAIEAAFTAKQRAMRLKNATETLSKINDIQGQISDITSSFFENQIIRNQQAADREIAILEKKKTDGLITEDEFNTEKEKIQKDAAREEAKIRRKSAIAERVGAVFSIAANTAIAIGKSIATFPPAGLPWSIIAGALGLGQIAAVTSKPLPTVPAFAGGVRGFGGGQAIINEKGGELVNLPSGSNVLTNAATKDLLFGSGGMSQVSNISNTHNNDNSTRNYNFNGIRDIGMARNKLLRSEGKGAFA